MPCKEKFGNYGCQSCAKSSNTCQFAIVSFILINQHYAEGSAISGDMIKEKVMFGNAYDNMDSGEDQNHNITQPMVMLLGCTTKEEGDLFRSQKANGIAGLFAKSNSSKVSPNIVDSALKYNIIDKNEFSVCFGQEGGYFTLGGSKPDRHVKGAKRYSTSYTQDYLITITSITVHSSLII